ncbi:hypothetical protein BJV82DRAFT_631679 [Fennellomyces sp. T-0311]|nr:hypothetical protein BJV82DRAFT_631679 [Fennellomyces sp. T-0311]
MITNVPVDAFTNLPSELSSQILFDLLGSDQDWSSIGSCLMVSNAWRSRILNSTIWHTVRLDSDSYDTAVVSAAIPVFMDKVQDLSLASVPHGVLSQCLACLSAGGFSSLRSLCLEGPTTDMFHQFSLDIRPCLSANRTLTHLTIIDSGDQGPDTPLSIFTVLSQCNSLTHLACESDGDLHDTLAPLPQQPTNIVHLELRYRRVPGQPLYRLLQRCPKLRSLLVQKCYDDDLIAIIRQSCPLLSALYYNMFNFAGSALPPDLGDGTGLRHFYVSHVSAFVTFTFNINEALSYIGANRATLQDLRINIPDDGQVQPTPFFDSSIGVFSNLRRVHFYDMHYREDNEAAFTPLLAEIINLCPNLEHLKIDCLEGMDPVFDALANSKLRDLDLDDVVFSDPNASYRAFTDRQATRPTIQNITIRACKHFTDLHLAQLAPIKSIQMLGLYRQDNVVPRGLSIYASMRPTTKVLHVEELCIRSSMDLDTVLQAVAAMECLETVSITSGGNKEKAAIPRDGLDYLLHQSKSISHIRVDEVAVKSWCQENPAEAQELTLKAQSKGVTVVGLQSICVEEHLTAETTLLHI